MAPWSGILRVRFIIVLSVVYLCMVLMLYHYLWKSHTLEHGLGLLESPQEDYDVIANKGGVVYSFKRRNGFFEKKNTSNSSSVSAQLSPPSSSAVLGANYNTLNRTQIRTASNHTMFSLSSLPPPSRCIHAFYYMWYGNPTSDGKYYHWNHRFLPHWNPSIAKKFPKGRHIPPGDIGASFYPELGCYSSRDPKVIEAHMYQLRTAGVGVVAVSWYPPGLADDEGYPPDPLLPLLLDAAWAYSIKVAVHIEPYKGRSARSVRGDLEYIVESYSHHPALYKLERPTVGNAKKLLPVVYMYDSYMIDSSHWAGLLKSGSRDSIRGTELDCVVIGLLVEKRHFESILSGGFDGFYTYFAADGFSYGSTVRNWRTLKDFARKHGLLFVPSFGPGYDDVRVRPWNQATTKSRKDGNYYRDMFQAAIESRVGSQGGGGETGIVSLTSFNEWGEGTQIEGAVSKTIDGFTYQDYRPNTPGFYLKVTGDIVSNVQCNL